MHTFAPRISAPPYRPFFSIAPLEISYHPQVGNPWTSSLSMTLRTKVKESKIMWQTQSSFTPYRKFVHIFWHLYDQFMLKPLRTNQNLTSGTSGILVWGVGLLRLYWDPRRIEKNLASLLCEGVDWWLHTAPPPSILLRIRERMWISL